MKTPSLVFEEETRADGEKSLRQPSKSKLHYRIDAIQEFLQTLQAYISLSTRALRAPTSI